MTESDDLRSFIRDLMARFDRGMDAVERKLETSREENRRYFEALDRRAEEEARRTDEIIAENRAQRDALSRILDRFDNGGTAPAAG
jgi:predicted phage gp36 major capsid-like protein